ncbi:MAG: VIT1/CCC1 transporter family protein [Patescibacteria group bacterium]
MANAGNVATNHALGRTLVRDELFDITLYKKYRAMPCGHLAPLLDELIPIEQKHLERWQSFFGVSGVTLNLRRRMRLGVLVFAGRVFGESAMHIVLDAIEVYGIRKYLSVWDLYKDTPLGMEVRAILEDEMHHEKLIVAKGIERRMNPERIRDIFLGFNDGLVEMLGAVSGFTAAFSDKASVMMAGFTVAVAGALSMAAGVFVSAGSEKEIKYTEARKQQFLGGKRGAVIAESAFGNAVVVGISYILGSMVPLLPAGFLPGGIRTSIIVSVVCVVSVSYILAFISGMDVRKRILTNVILIALAVSVSYGIGLVARDVFGISV